MTRDNAQPGGADPDATAATPPEPDAALELSLAPEDLLALARLPGMVRAAPSRPAMLVWYDNADAALADKRLILLRDGRTWRMQLLEPGPEADWPACSPAPALGEAAASAALSPAPPVDAAPTAAFEGRRRAYRAGQLSIDVLHGALRGVVETRPACRLFLAGPPPALEEALPALAGLRVSVPRASFPLEALAVAKGRKLPARHLGAPSVPAETTVTDGLATITAHLLDVLLYWSDQFQRDQTAEAVHQGRVATRRLRSGISLYKRAAPCPVLQEAGRALKSCASRLGAARDWDVFLKGAGTQLADMADEDARLASLLRAARRRRDEVYADLALYLAGADFRQLELALGCAASLRPWERAGDSSSLQAPTAAFAAEVLARRFKHVRRRGRNLKELPVPALHELRKDCKRLRYATEFFAPSFPRQDTKPFLKRLAALQEELGVLNDTAVATQLMGQLGRIGRGYAGGVVEGCAMAAGAPARKRIAKVWKRFRATPPFWCA